MYKEIMINTDTGEESIFEVEIEKNHQARLKTGTLECLEDYLEKIQMKIDNQKDDLIKHYRDYCNNLIPRSSGTGWIDLSENELKFLLQRESEIKNAILDRF